MCWTLLPDRPCEPDEVTVVDRAGQSSCPARNAESRVHQLLIRPPAPNLRRKLSLSVGGRSTDRESTGACAVSPTGRSTCHIHALAHANSASEPPMPRAVI